MKNRRALLLTLFAFLLNALLPFFATYELPQEGDVPSIFGDKILLCTAEGFTWVSRSDLQKQEHPQPHPDYECALCYVTAQGQAAGASRMVSIGSHLPVQVVTYAIQAGMPRPQEQRQPNDSRAPPFSFIG